MGDEGILEPSSAGGRSRELVWVLLLALLAGGLTLTVAPADASPASTAHRASCPSGSESQRISLPSGTTTTFCSTSADARDGGGTSAATPTISLSKTVGTDGSACATQDAITVPTATEVFYCYTVLNTGSVTVSAHDLEDDKLGSVLTNFNYVLGPGASTFATTSATISVDTVNVATWSATDGTDTAVATSTATVTIADGTTPGAPTIGTATAAEGESAVTWTAPTEDGGSPLTGYRVTPYLGLVAQTPVDLTGTGTSTTVTGLTNGLAYTFRVAAVNANGAGPDSDASNAVTPQWWMPWSSGPVAVDEIYTWLTGKAPTATEKSAWLAQLDAGTKLPGDLVAALRAGPDATGNVDPVVRLYSAYLVRIPDKSGLDFWINRRRKGWTLARISSNFAASHEFIRRYGTLTNAQFVNQIYINVLGRTGEPTGVAYWTRQLDQHRKSRGQVMLNFSESSEYKTKQVNKVHAAVISISLLGKTPSTITRDAFVAALVGGTSIADLVRAQIHLPPFATRAG